MQSSPLSGADDIQALRDLIARLPATSLVDFDEQIQLASVRSTVRVWRDEQQVVGFAYVDDYDNLWFETLPEHPLLDELEDQVIAWGVACINVRNAHALDCSCSADDAHRIQLLERRGFERQSVRTLRYSRPLSAPVAAYPLPQGFSMRSVQGESEVERLVALHRAAFGTQHMTAEQRLAMMRAPGYIPELDLVAVAPGGELAAFCVCGFADSERKIGYTDPIGTHPRYQRLGLAKALVSAGLIGLRKAGVQAAELGTSSENGTLQKLAAALGFVCSAEKVWFSKVVA
jgi:GNAT superfamily N-acetyltransferase